MRLLALAKFLSSASIIALRSTTTVLIRSAGVTFGIGLLSIVSISSPRRLSSPFFSFSLDEETTRYLAKKWSEFKKLVEDQERINVITTDLNKIILTKKRKFSKVKQFSPFQRSWQRARYAEIISKMPHAPKYTCIISGSPQKLPENIPLEKQSREEVVSKYYKDKQTIDELVKKFKDENDPLELLIVCDMFLTGFDAPLVHTMYVDKPLRDHNLIQAISRVNRVWMGKPEGMIIDYIGITDDLKRAFKAYNYSDIKGAMIPTEEIVIYMKQKHDGIQLVTDVSSRAIHSLRKLISDLMTLLMKSLVMKK